MKFYGWLTLAFIVLKLIDKIDWSWLWIFSPLWIEFCLSIVFAFIAVIGGRK